MISPFIVRAERDALIVSFAAPARVLSWAVLNGCFCYAYHIINCRVRGGDASFCAEPRRWLTQAVSGLDLQGKLADLDRLHHRFVRESRPNRQWIDRKRVRI